MTTSTEQWAKEYTEAMMNLPKVGTILKVQSGANARIDVDFIENAPPFLYARAYVPVLFGQETGWFLQATDTNQDCKGVKCILATKAREDLIRRQGLLQLPLSVKALRVIRTSKSGKSVIVEIVEHAPSGSQSA